MSAALAAMLVLLHAPCCDVFAAPPAVGVPADTAVTQTRHDDCGAPVSGERCAPWLDQVFVPADDAVLSVSAPSGVDAPLLSGHVSVPTQRMTGVVPRAGAPPPVRAVYLFTSRLLL
jgi:hypothetical protein